VLGRLEGDGSGAFCWWVRSVLSRESLGPGQRRVRGCTGEECSWRERERERERMRMRVRNARLRLVYTGIPRVNESKATTLHNTAQHCTTLHNTAQHYATLCNIS
jgi:hypothetical protein